MNPNINYAVTVTVYIFHLQTRNRNTYYHSRSSYRSMLLGVHYKKKKKDSWLIPTHNTSSLFLGNVIIITTQKYKKLALVRSMFIKSNIPRKPRLSSHVRGSEMLLCLFFFVVFLFCDIVPPVYISTMIFSLSLVLFTRIFPLPQTRNWGVVNVGHGRS